MNYADFQPQTEVERELFAHLLECRRERDDAEQTLARVRAILNVYSETFKETLRRRTKRAEKYGAP